MGSNLGSERSSVAGTDPDCRGLSRRVEELLPVAVHNDSVYHLPPLSADQAAALQTTSKYLNKAGPQVASFLLGCPPLAPAPAALVEFSTSRRRCGSVRSPLPPEPALR
jgi:hypothetical protein